MQRRFETCLATVAWIATGLVFVGVTGCESDQSGESGDEASAVQAKSESSSSESTDDKPGAAAEDKADRRDEKSGESQSTATVGEPAPDFTLKSASGNEHSLADYRGEIVVLEWTSTECPYVKRHHKEKTMQKALEKLGKGDVDVQWLGIDSSHFASAEASKKWKKKYGIEYPILLDPKGKVGKVYEAKTTPHMYVVGPDGTLRYQGAIDNDESGDKESPTNYVTKAVQALQNGEKVDPKTTRPYGCSVKYEG